jgi:hypothetical protein
MKNPPYGGFFFAILAPEVGPELMYFIVLDDIFYII